MLHCAILLHADGALLCCCPWLVLLCSVAAAATRGRRTNTNPHPPLVTHCAVTVSTVDWPDANCQFFFALQLVTGAVHVSAL